MFGRQSLFALIRDRLFESHSQTVLISARDEGGAGGRAHGGVGIGLQKSDSAGGNRIDVGGLVFAAAVAGKIRVAQIVGHDVDDVRLGRGILRVCGA